MSVPCEDYPWFPERLSPMPYRFCENFESLMKDMGRELVDRGTRVRRCWQLCLCFRGEDVIMKVYEESMNMAAPNCEQCRCNGWQHHPVSTRKIHFILPSPKATSFTEEQLFDSKTHVLHGAVHLNGFGHLMRINGLEGGSQFLRGTQVMMLWDALCHCLRVRDVSVEDVSSKKGMLLRVLLPILNMSTFYMQHGYSFGRGQFNVSEANWKEAVEKLNKTELVDLLVDFDGVDETVQRIILRYGRSEEDSELQTLGTLLERMFFLAENEWHALQFGMQQLIKAEPNGIELTTLMEKMKQESTPPVANGVCTGTEEHERESDVQEEVIPSVSQALESLTVNTFPCPTVDEVPVSVSQSAESEAAWPESEQETDHKESVDIHLDEQEEVMAKTPRKSKKRIPMDDPGDLSKPRIAPFNAASLFEGTRKYSATKMIEIIRITLGVLQSYEDRWVRLQELRDILYETAHDRVLADFVLGRMANTIVNGFSIIKQRSKIARCNYYLFEKYNGREIHEDPESFLCQVDEPASPAPGPEEVNGQSLERFETYLALLFKWMCHQPHVSIGRGPNKNKPKPKRKEPEADRFNYPSGCGGVRLTRSSLLNASKRSRIEPPRPIKKPWMERYPSEVAPHMELLRSAGPQPGMLMAFRKSVLVDLLYLYQSVLETYKPLTESQKTSLRLPEFPRYVQTLKDTKFFVKRFQMDPVPAVMEANGTPGLLRFVCQVILDTTVPPGLENSRLKDDQPEFFKHPPPPEEVYVPKGSSMVTVKHVVEEAFSRIYSMFELWSVKTMSNFKLETAVLEAPCEKTIEVKGHRFRPELELRHSGGIEDWEVLCSCGTRDDDGARMLCCDSCSVWMHTRCAGFRDDMDVPSFFQCAHCRHE